jgi:hypothetical protein
MSDRRIADKISENAVSETALAASVILGTASGAQQIGPLAAIALGSSSHWLGCGVRRSAAHR